MRLSFAGGALFRNWRRQHGEAARREQNGPRRENAPQPVLIRPAYDKRSLSKGTIPVVFFVVVVVFLFVVFVVIFLLITIIVVTVVVPVVMASGATCGRRRIDRLGADNDVSRRGSGIAGRVGGGVSDGVNASRAAAGAFGAEQEGANVGTEGNGTAVDGLDIIRLISITCVLVWLIADDRDQADGWIG